MKGMKLGPSEYEVKADALSIRHDLEMADIRLSFGGRRPIVKRLSANQMIKLGQWLIDLGRSMQCDCKQHLKKGWKR